MPRKRWYRSKYLWLTIFMVISLGSLGAWEFFTVKADKPIYIFGIVDRGTIVSQVVAQGTLAAVTTVDVGTQVSGTIAELHADFNSEVKKGQILAKLNQDLFLADVKQQEAGRRDSEGHSWAGSGDSKSPCLCGRTPQRHGGHRDSAAVGTFLSPHLHEVYKGLNCFLHRVD